MSYLSLLAFMAGAAIATQASMNAQLGVLLRNPLLGTSVAFVSSLLFTLLAVIVFTKKYPSLEAVRAVPSYLWFSGGLLSAFGISMFYYLIPRMGIGVMMSYALTGQIIVAVIAGHYGWFDLPTKPLNGAKLVGVLSLIIGIVLINRE
ncbi:DMT family transporter [Aliikangiella coralliicola]|uniref:DMT family transporter n=1 Tax=Aliikangiella coralliicola TaxID=2592383 RepID=A0A545UCF9_9GAMM|nr:DMT family transporter [Aliikangiella coralliicola]TQV87147.1 DMT family transporter [Aliikangiella coralliicola]